MLILLLITNALFIIFLITELIQYYYGIIQWSIFDEKSQVLNCYCGTQEYPCPHPQPSQQNSAEGRLVSEWFNSEIQYINQHPANPSN